jgi:uncharacterized Zn finger protein (UPF0148 family)
LLFRYSWLRAYVFCPTYGPEESTVEEEEVSKAEAAVTRVAVEALKVEEADIRAAVEHMAAKKAV